MTIQLTGRPSGLTPCGFTWPDELYGPPLHFCVFARGGWHDARLDHRCLCGAISDSTGKVRVTGRITQTASAEFDIPLSDSEAAELLEMPVANRAEWVQRRAAKWVAASQGWREDATRLDEHHILARESDFPEE